MVDMKVISIKLLLICSILCLILGCVPSDRAGQGRSYRSLSGDYIIYRFSKDDTLPAIAKAFLGQEEKAWLIEDANEKSRFKANDPVVIPLKENRIGGLYENGYQGVPILCYHQFGDGRESSMVMPTDIFEKQMRYLKENGYRVISPEELMDFLAFRKRIPKKAVLISIDDGFRSVYEIAFPILKKYGFTATLFIYTDYIGVSNKALTWDQLREMKGSGFSIGSHSVSHSDLTKKMADETDAAYYKRVKKELVLSKKILDKELSQETRFFSFPYGQSDETLMKMAKDADYSIAVTVNRGSNAFFSNPLDLNRDMVLNRDMETFVSRLITFNPVSLR